MGELWPEVRSHLDYTAFQWGGQITQSASRRGSAKHEDSCGTAHGVDCVRGDRDSLLKSIESVMAAVVRHKRQRVNSSNQRCRSDIRVRESGQPGRSADRSENRENSPIFSLQLHAFLLFCIAGIDKFDAYLNSLDDLVNVRDND